jgi:hypothetical protein
LEKHCITCHDREQEELREKELIARYNEVRNPLKTSIMEDFIKTGNCFTLQELFATFSKPEEISIIEDIMEGFVMRGNSFMPKYGTYQGAL